MKILKRLHEMVPDVFVPFAQNYGKEKKEKGGKKKSTNLKVL